jgi:hypothetical protein
MRPAPQSFAHCAVWLVSVETAVLPGFSSLIILLNLVELAATLAYRFTSGPGVRHRLLMDPLQAQRALTGVG